MLGNTHTGASASAGVLGTPTLIGLNHYFLEIFHALTCGKIALNVSLTADPNTVLVAKSS